MKNIIYFVYLIFLLFCFCDFTDQIQTQDQDVQSHKIYNLEFRTIIHSRNFIFESTPTQLVILRTLNEQNLFLDTTETMTNYINFNSYEDSLLIGLIYGSKVSVSSSFSIDSVIVDSSMNHIIVKSNLFIPIGRMTPESYQCHFIAIPKTDLDIIMDDIKIIHQSTDGEILEFNNFLKGSDGFLISEQNPLLVVLRNQQDENQFLDTISYFTDFPNFIYGDFILVGLISRQYNHVTPFEIVSLINIEDTIKVSGQYYYVGMLPAISRPYHFVTIRRSDLPIQLDEIISIYSYIE